VRPWSPSATVGVVGAGQLARMTQQAAIDLGVELRMLGRGPTDAAAAIGNVSFGDPRDLDELRRLAGGCDVVTFDHELIPHGHLVELESEGHLLRPSAHAKLAAQDKLHARTAMSAAGFPVPRFEPVASIEEVERFAGHAGWPLVLKRRTGGYDGRGVLVASDRDEAEAAGVADGGWIAEELVPILCELSQIVVRGADGEIVAYPLVRTFQEDGICVETVAPADVPGDVAERSRAMAEGIAATIGAVGIVAVELFLTAGGEVLINELALRPHNTGHFTIEACVTSQFENHLRAVLGWPLGETRLLAPAVAMRNLIGTGEANPAENAAAALREPGAHLHLYGKEPAGGRKLGHVTALADSPDEALRTCRRAIQNLQPKEVQWTS
jgi:5-(carboxyamino)imidazole ribonucleotide synthase